MPRLAASSRGTGLSDRNSENIANVTNMKGKGVLENRTRSTTGVKRHAEEPTLKAPEYNAKTRRRAALGEITNVSLSLKLLLATNWIFEHLWYLINTLYQIHLFIG